MKTALLMMIMLLGLTAFDPALAAHDTLRCGSKIITTGLSMDEVLKFCGEPQDKVVEDIPVRSGNRVTGTTKKHTWTYARSGGKPAVLTFDQEKLVSIDYP